VHRAARAFGGAVDAYDRGRPEYPPEAVDWLVRTLDLGEGRTALDLAAGTGKLTEPLARTRARVIAVEPSAEMLNRLRVRLPAVEAHEGTADAIPLADGSVDAIAVGQAFHWFANEAALAEMRRVLRPGGRLALVWNRRDLEARAHDEIERILTARRGHTPSHLHGDWRATVDAFGGFAPVAEATFRFEQRLDRAGLVDRVTSVSFIAALPDAERQAVVAEAEAAAARLGEPVVLPYLSELHGYVRR
jgi:SAM-dependent methyltransferase